MWAFVRIAWSIVRLVFRLLGVLLVNPVRRLRVRWTFWRRLRRAGLSYAEVEELSAAYRPALRIRDLVRLTRSHGG